MEGISWTISTFFYVVAKGNLGEAGAGGVILCPMKESGKKYAWGLGVATNNREKELNLWQGLRQVLDNGITHLSVFVDSLITIKKCIKRSKHQEF